MRQLPASAWHRLRTDRRAALSVGVAILLNLVVIAVYVWSRGGQTTTVVATVQGDTGAVVVDGKLQWAYADVANLPSRGGIVLTLADTENLPSLPRPRGIDRVRVVDMTTREVLFEDDFSGGPSDEWQITGPIIVRDGVVGSRGDVQLALPAREWGDVEVEAIYKNTQSAGITLRAQRNLYGLSLRVRPFHWNEDASRWISGGLGFPASSHKGVEISLDRTQSLKSIAAMVTRPYPYALLLGLIALLVVALLEFVPLGWLRELKTGIPGLHPGAIAGAFALIVLIVTLNFGYADRDNMPFVPDSVAYLFQAKIFASGHLTTDPPPVRGAFDFFVPAPFVLTDSSWAAQFPFVHPFVLAVGQVFGAPWLMPPVLAAGSAALIFAVGYKMYGNMRVAALAAALLATSPFFIMNVTNLMSHNTGGFFILASLACLAMAPRRPLLFGALGGIAFGLLLNARPLTAVALVIPFGAYLLWQLVPKTERRSAGLQLAGFIAGGAVMALLFLGWNYALTGDAFRTGYQATGVTFFPTGTLVPSAPPAEDGIVAAIGGGGDHDGDVGVQNERMQLALLLLVLHGWPQFIGLMFSLLPFLLGTRKVQDWFFLTCAVATTAVWMTYEGAGVMYGPRYWYESMPFLMLLAARGADRAADLLASFVASLRDGTLEPHERPLLTARAVSYGFVGVMILISVNGWLLGNRAMWQADLVPNTASAMCCVLGIDDRIERLVQEQDLHNALVLVDPCDNNFVCYGSVFWRNNVTLDGDIVYAKDIINRRDEIIAAYPDRQVYLATYMTEGSPDVATLQPYTR